MVEFLHRNRVLLASVCVLLLSLLLVATSIRNPSRPDPIARLLLDSFAPFQKGVTWLAGGVASVWQGYIALVGIERENRALREEVNTLRGHLVRLAELEHANQRLERLLGLRQSIGPSAIPARVIARDPLPWAGTLTLDRGARDGLRRGMAVVSAEGVVGRVTEVGWLASRVLLLIDYNSGIDAMVQRSRARGIVQGALKDGCRMKYLRLEDDVRVGDRVVTAGMDGIFPKGVMVGQVTSIEEDAQTALRVARLVPSVRLDRLEEVLVIEQAEIEIDGGEPQ